MYFSLYGKWCYECLFNINMVFRTYYYYSESNKWNLRVNPAKIIVIMSQPLSARH